MTTAFSIDAAGALPGPDWLVARRRAAADAFTDAAMPSAEEEVWRYSRIGDLDLSRYIPLDAGATAGPPSDRVADLIDIAGGADLVVLTADGRLVDAGADVDGVAVGTPAAETDSALGDALGPASDALGSLHDAFAEPVEITVAAGRSVDQIVVVHRFEAEGTATFPRLVLRAEQGAQVSLVEIYVSADGVGHLTLPVTELLVGRDATVRHASIQLLGDAAWQIARLASTVDQGGTLRSGTAAFGGDYSRLRADTVLAGRGAHGDLYAGYFGSGTQLLDFRTFQDHVAPDTTSNLLFKGALGDKSASVYTGLIKIRPDARGSQAFQTNRNLKLSDDAWAESVPNLEIENNEVQCSHASTVGPIDQEQRFYLESRGVPTERAERLIVKGIFDEVFEALPAGPYESLVRSELDLELERSMP